MGCAHISAWPGSKGREMERHWTQMTEESLGRAGLDDWNNAGTVPRIILLGSKRKITRP
jgi:hypothetical protein